MTCAWVRKSNPTYTPSRAVGSSFCRKALGTCTKLCVPNARRRPGLNSFPKTREYGVAPLRAFVGLTFRTKTAWWRANAQKLLSRFAPMSMLRVMSCTTLMADSTMPFRACEYAGLARCTMPCALQKALKFAPRNSDPLSLWRVDPRAMLMGVSGDNARMSSIKRLNAPSASDLWDNTYAFAHRVE